MSGQGKKAEAGARVELGATFGRWTVMAYVAPAQRGGEVHLRARVLVRCVCTIAKPVFECDLKAGRTTGCRSLRCRYTWEARRTILAQLQALPATPERDDG